MNKRLLKRHKRQVSRAKERVRLSEPDLRTPEQLTAAREVSRAVGQPANRPPPTLLHAIPKARRSGPNQRGESGRRLMIRARCLGSSPHSARIADPSISEAQVLEMSWRWLSNGFFNPAGALFAVTAFSCSAGKFPLEGQPKPGPVAPAPPFLLRPRLLMPQRQWNGPAIPAGGCGCYHRSP